MQDFKTLIYQNSLQENLIISNHEKLTCHLSQKVSDFEKEKVQSFVYFWYIRIWHLMYKWMEN
jgi:hypothetical protein